ncbi:Amino acid transporter family protein [Spironucleus salmonicida]|nr:Amino acid transporter family protein [Spironucleus salmonicida]
MTHTNLLSSGFIVHQLGAVPALLLFIACLALNFVLQFAYIDYIDATNSTTISQLNCNLFKNRFLLVFLDIIIIFLPLGTLATQILSVSNAILNMFQSYSSINFQYMSQAITVATAAVFFLPSMFLTSVKAFNAISPFSILIAIFYTFSMLVLSAKPQNAELCNGILSQLQPFPVTFSLSYFLQILKLFPTIIFAVNITVSVPIVYRDALSPKRRNTKICILCSSLIVFSEFLISGFSAANFGAATLPSNLGTAQQCKLAFTNALPLVYAGVLVVAYPLWAQPNRYCTMELMRVPIDNRLVFCSLGAVLVLITTVLAVFVTDIQTIFGLFASFCGWFLYFLVPGMCWIQHDVQSLKLGNVEGETEMAIAEAHIATDQGLKQDSKIRKIIGCIFLGLLAIVSLVSFSMNIWSFIQ